MNQLVTILIDGVTYASWLFIVALGFLVTLLLPQLPLRKRDAGGPPALE